MRGENHRAAARAEALDQVPHLPAGHRVESGCWFVEKEQLRVTDQRAGNRQPLLLTAGERPHARIDFVVELDLREDRPHVEWLVVKTAKERQGFQYRQLFGKLGFLERDADFLPQRGGIAHPGAAEYFHGAGVGLEQPFADFEGCRLARAIWPKEAKALRRRHFEVDPRHGNDVAIALAEASDRERWCRGGH